MSSTTTGSSSSVTAASPSLAPSRPSSSLIYFAFGSNLSSTQMKSRCPKAKGMSLGRLRNHTFIINERGYANVVPSTSTSTSDVYGVLWQLDSSSEKASLDRHEGVRLGCYEDMLLPVEILDRQEKVVGVVWALCYVDRLRTTSAAPREEYIGRMNTGIEQATKDWGLPERYVWGAIRKFIPER